MSHEYSLVEMPFLVAGDERRDLRGCDVSGVFMPCVLIVFLLLMQTLSVITFSSDRKLQALWDKNVTKEWDVCALHPHYKAFRSQTTRPKAAVLSDAAAAPASDAGTLCRGAGCLGTVVEVEREAVTLGALRPLRGWQGHGAPPPTGPLISRT